MNKSKLPKAILRTADDMRARPGRGDHGATSSRSWSRRRTTAARTAGGACSRWKCHGADREAETSAWNGDCRRWRCATSTRRRRRPQASRSSNAMPTIRPIGGVIPVPLANAASDHRHHGAHGAGRLSALYGVPFERNRARAIVIGLMGRRMPTGLATVATSTLYLLRARV